MADKYLVTGAMGCIGAWTLYHLVQQGKQAVSFDLSDDRARLDLLLTRDEQAAITFTQGDVRDFDAVRMVIDDQAITHVIHLAALQVPACRANPVLGSQVNVTGTVNVFEAARQSGIQHVTYASSIAIFGAREDYPTDLLPNDAPTMPHTLYGVYKVCNEQTARVYWRDHGITSNALRPYTVYGVGRDQGLTSEPTKAILAATKGEPYHITFGGKMQFHFVSDVAQQFIVAAEQPLGGAFAFNMGMPATAVTTFAQLLMEIEPSARVTVNDQPLAFPEACDPAELHRHFDRIYETPLHEGIAATLAHFRKMFGG